jgi:hypothetical protein
VLLDALMLFVGGVFGAIEHDEEPRKYSIAGGTLTAKPIRLVLTAGAP